MRPSRLQLLSGLLIVTLTNPAALLHAADADSRLAGQSPGIRGSALQAARALAMPSGQTSGAPSSPTPRTLPRTGRTSRQMSGGGGSFTMVMGLLSTAAGVAGSYFVYKALKNQNAETQPADR